MTEHEQSAQDNYLHIGVNLDWWDKAGESAKSGVPILY